MATASTQQPAPAGIEPKAVQAAGSTEKPTKPKAARRRKAPAKRLTAHDAFEQLVKLAGERDQPRSTVGLEVGPRGQVQPRVTTVTGEDPARVDAAVAKACAVLDYLVDRYKIDLAGANPTPPTPSAGS